MLFDSWFPSTESPKPGSLWRRFVTFTRRSAVLCMPLELAYTRFCLWADNAACPQGLLRLTPS